MKAIGVLIVLFVLPAVIQARPVKKPTHSNLLNRADFVAIVTLEDVVTTSAVCTEYPDPKFYNGYAAICRISAGLKGTSTTERISILFFQTSDGRPGFNGAIPAPFKLNDKAKYVYLVFLRQTEVGNLFPVTEEYEAGLSVIRLEDDPANSNIQLPKKDKTANKSSEATPKPVAPQ